MMTTDNILVRVVRDNGLLRDAMLRLNAGHWRKKSGQHGDKSAVGIKGARWSRT